MEERKLTKADIDKVRHIEGFPIAKDEDIIALSRPPYYTACPNPFIEEFIQENGTPYDEATDDYHREPFAADVSEGKSDPIYVAHSYHTKVPHKAIMRYILHYTKPGDVVFDGFCGTGMTGVAAQMCGCPDSTFKAQIENEMPGTVWGARHAVLNDLSPAATFIAHNYNIPVDSALFADESKALLDECEAECGWLYETQHVDPAGNPVRGIDGEIIKCRINYAVWSDILVCPSCSREFVFWDVAVDKEAKSTRDEFECPGCRSKLKKRDCEHAKTTYYDTALHQTVTVSKQVPVMLNYSFGRDRYDKAPDQEDFALIEKIDAMEPPYWMPTDELPYGYNTEQPKKSHGYLYVHQFFTKRNAITISTILNKIENRAPALRGQFLNAIRSSMSYSTKFVKVNVGRILTNGGLFSFGSVTGTLYIPSLMGERPILDAYAGKLEAIKKIINNQRLSIVSTGSMTDVPIKDNTIDYIFTDPPFGGNLNYSELNFIWESWIKVKTNNSPEAIINDTQKKGLAEYQELMERSFKEYYRVLKPNHWMTVEFHNSQNSIWNAISEGLMRAGFIVADIRVLDKKGVSFQQATSATAVKQDLVISAYKPRESFVREFQQRAGDPEMAWEFVRQHLRNVPVTADGNHDGKLDIMPELLDMLKENFVQDDKGAWYVPDLTNAADLAKVRRKALLKEFWDSCATGKGKLKVFRMEAIRAGFDECWKTRDFKTIVSVGERLPEAVLQEDPALLMYYDNACSRV